MGNCSVDDCDRSVAARSWCRRHYYRWRRNGHPTVVRPRPRKPAAERFWSKVDRRSATDCWEWQAARDPLGYGFFRMVPAETMWRAHRAAWVLTNGPIPDGMLACHHCDNPPCCNPAHLFLGSNADNMSDRNAKGREPHNPGRKGEDSWLARLTEAQVIEIRERYAAGGTTYRELAPQYGVGEGAIGKIIRRDRWNY